MAKRKQLPPLRMKLAGLLTLKLESYTTLKAGLRKEAAKSFDNKVISQSARNHLTD